MSAPFRLQVVERLEELPIDGADWNRLVSQSETNTVFQTYEWFASWHEIFGNRQRLWFLLVYGGTQLIGIAPFARAARAVRFASERYADYCDIIAGPHKEEALRAILQFLANERGIWRTLTLQNLPAHSTTPLLLKRLAPEMGLRFLVRGNVPCPAIALGGSSESHKRLLRKQSLRRPHDFFRRNGRLVFRNVTDVDQALELLPPFFAQHMERWRRERCPSLFLDGDNRRFYQALVRRLLPRGWLTFSVVEYNGHPIAFHLGFDYGDAFLWYKPSFDVRFERRSPGNVMLRFLIEQAIRTGKKEFDFTVGDEAFKRRYSNLVRCNTNILVSSGLRSHALMLAAHAAKRLVRLALGKPS